MPVFLDKPTWYGDNGSVVEPVYITSGSANTLAGQILTLDSEGCIGGRLLNQGAEGAIYAPDRGGFAGQILRSSGSGSAPTWVTPIISMVNNSANAGQVIYAPITGGTTGQILISGGSGAPTWTNAIPSTASIFASQVQLSAAKFGASNLQAFLDKLDDILTGTSSAITGITVSGTVTANTFNAT